MTPTLFFLFCWVVLGHITFVMVCHVLAERWNVTSPSSVEYDDLTWIPKLIIDLIFFTVVLAVCWIGGPILLWWTARDAAPRT